MPYRLDIRINQLPVGILNSRESWQSRHRQTLGWDRLVWGLIQGRKPEAPLLRAKLTLVRHSAQSSDWDNLASSWKHPVDALVTNGILADDSWAVIGMPEISQQTAPLKKGFITILVEEVVPHPNEEGKL